MTFLLSNISSSIARSSWLCYTITSLYLEYQVDHCACFSHLTVAQVIKSGSAPYANKNRTTREWPNLAATKIALSPVDCMDAVIVSVD